MSDGQRGRCTHPVYVHVNLLDPVEQAFPLNPKLLHLTLALGYQHLTPLTVNPASLHLALQATQTTL